MPRSIKITELFIPTAFLLGKIFDPRGRFLQHSLLPRLRRVTPDTGFFTLQSITQDLRVMQIVWGNSNGINEFGLVIHTNMRLHPKVPRVALAGLVHIRITLLAFVLRGGGYIDERGVNEGASTDF